MDTATLCGTSFRLPVLFFFLLMSDEDGEDDVKKTNDGLRKRGMEEEGN